MANSNRDCWKKSNSIRAKKIELENFLPTVKFRKQTLARFDETIIVRFIKGWLKKDRNDFEEALELG